MRRRLRRSRPAIAAAFAAAIVFLAVVPAAAHENAAPVTLDPPEVRPGGVVTVRLEDLSADGDVALFLVSGDGRVSLGTVQADGEGHASVEVAIPAELEAGVYAVAAIQGGGTSVSAPLGVAGLPLAPEGGAPGQRDEDDPLLFALPSGWQQSLSGPVITAVPVTVTQPAPSDGRPPGPALAIVLVIVAIGAVGAAVVARRPAPS